MGLRFSIIKCVASSGCGDRFSGNRTAEFGSLVDEVGPQESILKIWAQSGKPFPESGFFRKNPDSGPDLPDFFGNIYQSHR